MLERRKAFGLLFPSAALVGCAASDASDPDLPQSISPGWTRVSFARGPAPSAVPKSGEPQCWKADYSGQAAPRTSAEVWACRYKTTESAFDAMQRARTEAQMVKFQQGSYLVLVKWNDAPKAGIAALVRAIQKAVQP